jgi:hypothetical protein
MLINLYVVLIKIKIILIILFEYIVHVELIVYEMINELLS